MDPFDCEALRTGFPRQPVNTLSSVAFLIAAVVLWRRGNRLAAASIGLAGLGSLAYHGAPSWLATVLHDVGLYGSGLVAAVVVWSRIRERRVPWASIVVFVVGAAVWVSSRSGGPLCSPRSVAQGHAMWHALAATAYALLFVDEGFAVSRQQTRVGRADHDSRFGGTGSGPQSGRGA